MEISQIINLFYLAFDGLKSIMRTIIDQTIFRYRPEVADSFSTTISLLITITAIYLILIFISSAKKVLGIILALGWGLLVVSIVLSAIGI
jgi:hypothetical protein